MNVLIDQEVAQKNYLTIPYSHGLSFDYKDSSYSVTFTSFQHCIVIFDGSFNYDELLVFFDPTSLEELDCFLIKTFYFQKGNKIAEEIIKFDSESEKFINIKVKL